MTIAADEIGNGRLHDDPRHSEENVPLSEEHADIQNAPKRERPISYWTLLASPQMAILCFLRIAGHLATLSTLSYLIFQLRYLSPNASEEELSMHAGLLVGAKTFAKVCTGIFWGMLSDAHGRKGVLLAGLIGSGTFGLLARSLTDIANGLTVNDIAAVANMGYGFSTNFPMAIFWQVLQGAASNEIATTRTIAAELYVDADSTDRSRALTLPLLVSGIGMILGPVLGGFASNREGLGLFSRHPYALPNFIVALWYAVSAVLVFFWVEETLRRDQLSTTSVSSHVSTMIRRVFGIRARESRTSTYQAVPQEESISMVDRQEVEETSMSAEAPREQRPLFLQIWTAEVIAVMTAHFIITGHITTFGTIYTIFLSTAVEPASQSSARAGASETDEKRLPSFLIQGGLGLSPPQVGTLLTSATVLFAFLQGLVFPRLLHRLGTVRLWRFALLLFPIIYLVAPLPHLLTSSSHTTILSWMAISVIMVLYMAGQALAMPPMVILISECVPHPATRGTTNAIGAMVGNLARTLFPVLVMFVYSVGLKNGILAGAFWLLSGLAGVAIVSSRWVGIGLDERIVLKKKSEDAAD